MFGIADFIIIFLIFAGFGIQTILVLLLNKANREFYIKILNETAIQTAKTTIILLGKIDENTDVTSLNLTQSYKTSQKVSDVQKDVHTLVDKSMPI